MNPSNANVRIRWRNEERVPLMARRKVKLVPGSVVSIDLGDGKFACGLLLRPPLMRFFDFEFSGGVDALAALSRERLFDIWVMNDAIQSGRWPVVAVIDPADQPDPVDLFFKQDPINGKLNTYQEKADGTLIERPATLDEISGLERAAVWSATHVEDRLRDHFAGRPNKGFESMRPKADDSYKGKASA